MIVVQFELPNSCRASSGLCVALMCVSLPALFLSSFCGHTQCAHSYTSFFFLCVQDMYIRVYNYNTTERIKAFEAHQDYIRSLAVHPTLPYVLSASDDMTIKLWDWDKGVFHLSRVFVFTRVRVLSLATLTWLYFPKLR